MPTLLLPLALLALSAGPLRAATVSAAYGHLPYDEASPGSLADAGSYRRTGRVVRLRREAADVFKKMAAAAAADGVHIVPISGFRSVAQQRALWERAVKRRGSEAAAAKWVAPPGHSEHHTGWALDLGDLEEPATDIEISFEKTKSSAWLKVHGAEFSFDLSFPPDNAQGVSHEPWHWRYTGADEARRLFHPPQ